MGYVVHHGTCSWLRRGLAAFCVAAPLFLSGCYVAVVGIVVGVLSIDDGGSSPSDVPVVRNLCVDDCPGAPGRPVDLSAVRIAFQLVGGPADLTVELREECSGCTWRLASIVESTEGLETGDHELTWQAALDGLVGFNRLSLRVTPANSPHADETSIEIGNDAPTAVVLQPDGQNAAPLSQNVVVEFTLEDEALDPVSVELLYSVDGEEKRVPGAHVSGRTSGLPPDGEAHSLTWESNLTLGPSDFQGMKVGILAIDEYGASQGIVWSAPFDLGNNSPPQVVGVTEPVFDPDGDSPVALRFRLRDDEEDPADVILQWSDGGGFPDITDLIANEDLRRRVLEDPAARPAWNIVTARPRTIAETRVRLLPRVPESELPWTLDPAGIPGVPRRREPLRSELVLWGLDPPGSLSPLVGSALQLLSDGGAVEQIGRILAVDPRRHAVILDGRPDPAPRQGQRARVLAKQGLVALETSSSGAGREYSVTWDVAADAPSGAEAQRYLIRATAVTDVKPGPSFDTSAAKEIAAFPLGYGEATTLPLPEDSRPQSVIASDLNADGAVDLIATGLEEILVFLNAQGDASFPESSRSSLPTDGVKPHVLAAADLDGDGTMDLISGEGEPGSTTQVSLHFGAGDGTFPRKETLHTEDAPQALLVAELDADGKMYLVWSEAGACLRVFRGGEDLVPVEWDKCPGQVPRAIIASDVDADGKSDLVAALPEGLQVFPGEGDGTFGDATGPLRAIAFPRAVAASDLDGDGNLDLVSAETSLALFLGRGDGSFGPGGSLPGPGAQAILSAVAAVDLNLDGAVDLVSADRKPDGAEGSNPSQLSIHLGLGGAQHAPPRLLRTGEATVALAVSDLNGDGAPDLVSADRDSLTLFLSPGAGAFRAGEPLETGAGPRAVVACDLDADGTTDLVSADSNENKLSIFWGLGTARFEPVPLTLDTSLPFSLAAADLDGDGALDLVAGHTIFTLSIFWGDGDRAFVPGRESAVGQFQFVTAPYLNHDGLPDLVSLSKNTGEISRFLGAGDRRLERMDPTVSNSHRGGMVVTDVDADGDADVVLAGSELVLLRGRNDGTLETEQALATGLDATAVVDSDIDADGAIDLIVADKGSTALRVFLARKDGFEEPEPLRTGSHPVAISAADFDADGTLDLASADRDANELSVFLGRGGGAFELRRRALPVGNRPEALAAADLDSDGAMDLVSADRDSNRLTILLGGVQRPLSPAFWGTSRPAGPALPARSAEALILEPRERPYRIDTSSGAIDGVRSAGFLGRAFHFESIEIRSGARVVTGGGHPLILFVSGDVTIDGELRLDGEAAAGSTGGQGGPGGGGGGTGGGLLGTGTLAGMRGEGGGAGERATGLEAAGGGGGFAAAGGSGSPGVRGGPPYGSDRLDPLQGGSGGGGGSAREHTASGRLVGRGGGGGGGGGALRITTGGNITIGGRLTASGGSGDRGATSGGGHGGGGSGGSILLEAGGGIDVSPGAIAAEGGKGASGDGRQAGGDGSPGRILWGAGGGRPLTRR